MKVRIITILLFVVSFSQGIAQKVDFGKVTVAALEEKKHPIDTAAVAAILFNKARTFFSYDPRVGFSINTENTFRIKIYKKEVVLVR